MKSVILREGLGNRVEIDSAGTGDWHTGDLPDSRMRRHAAERGYELTSRARQVRPDDFDMFDLIIVMDHQNLRDLKPFARTAANLKKVRLFCEFCSEHPETEVPDPYYGGAEGFETVLDLVEDGCEGILRAIPRAAK